MISKLIKFLFLLLLVGILAAVAFFGCERVGIKPPVAITFRDSLMDSTQVLQVTNKSGSETLVMKIEARSKDGKQTATHVFKVRPGETYEVGRLEMNWLFREGETYIIEADGYPLPIKGTVPE